MNISALIWPATRAGGRVLSLLLLEQRRERVVALVLARARVGIVQPRTALTELAGWARPALAAAAAIAGISLASLAMLDGGPAGAERVGGVEYEPTPESLGGWLLAGGEPIEALAAEP